MRRLAAVAVLLATVAACSTRPPVKILDATPRPAKDAAAIEIVSTTPERPFDTIAIWVGGADESRNGHSLTALRRSAVNEAARLGADAIILTVDRKQDALLSGPRIENEREPRTIPVTRLRARAELIVWR